MNIFQRAQLGVRVRGGEAAPRLSEGEERFCRSPRIIRWVPAHAPELQTCLNPSASPSVSGIARRVTLMQLWRTTHDRKPKSRLNSCNLRLLNVELCARVAADSPALLAFLRTVSGAARGSLGYIHLVGESVDMWSKHMFRFVFNCSWPLSLVAASLLGERIWVCCFDFDSCPHSSAVRWMPA